LPALVPLLAQVAKFESRVPPPAPPLGCALALETVADAAPEDSPTEAITSSTPIP